MDFIFSPTYSTLLYTRVRTVWLQYCNRILQLTSQGFLGLCKFCFWGKNALPKFLEKRNTYYNSLFIQNIIFVDVHCKPSFFNSLCPHFHRENLLSLQRRSCLHYYSEPVFKTGGSLHAPCSTLHKISV